MSKKVYSVSLDTKEVNTFKGNNHVKLSTFLNEHLKKFNVQQSKALFKRDMTIEEMENFNKDNSLDISQSISK